MTTREIKNMGKAKKMKVSKSGGESDTFQPYWLHSPQNIFAPLKARPYIYS
jgi:hypothetical protein